MRLYYILYIDFVKWVPSYLHCTKQVENQAGRIQDFQSDPHKKLSWKNNNKQTQ